MAGNSWLGGFYLLLNVASVSGLIFANKFVLTTLGFRFTYALSFLHTCATICGLQIFIFMGAFKPKKISGFQVLDLAAAFVGYLVLGNLSLQLNAVGFYQVMKVLNAAACMLLEYLMFRKVHARLVIISVIVVLFGVILATGSDGDVSFSGAGLLVAVLSIFCSALFQIWVGSKQKLLELGSLQLVHQYAPYSALLLGVIIPFAEPVGFLNATPDTLLGFNYTWVAIVGIILSSALGVVVSLSTFLAIGATSPVTFNIAGHTKSIVVVVGGAMLFGDVISPMKGLGYGIAIGGMAWYSYLKMNEHSAKVPLSPAMSVDSRVVSKGGTMAGTLGGVMSGTSPRAGTKAPDLEPLLKGEA